MLKAVLMDFDGLILDTENLAYEIYKNWFTQNHDIELTINDFLVCVGSHPRDLIDFVEKENNIKIDQKPFYRETETLKTEKSKILPPREGVEEFIKSVKGRGLKLILTTSANRNKPLTHLRRLGLLKYFDDLVTADDVDYIKPEPDLFNKAIDILKVKKNEALIVEDSLNGLIAGNKAGVPVLVCPNAITNNFSFEKAYTTVDSLSEISIDSIIKDFNGE